jgi:hypothetical protein
MGKRRTKSERISQNAELIECLWLVKNNVPFDVAFSLPPQERFGWAVILAQFEGSDFDFAADKWKPRK